MYENKLGFDFTYCDLFQLSTRVLHLHTLVRNYINILITENRGGCPRRLNLY